MQIAVQILYTEGWKDMAEIVIPVAAKYCNKHGYKLCVVCYAGEYYSDFGYNKLRKVNKRFHE
jgi:predicted N-acetyltransferase YhbS